MKHLDCLIYDEEEERPITAGNFNATPPLINFLEFNGSHSNLVGLKLYNYSMNEEQFTNLL
jgi:hypothetical protein